jgi:hypothetical protein
MVRALQIHMQSVQDVTTIPMPVPETLYGTYATATGTLTALVSALKTVVSADAAKSISLRTLLTAAARSNVSVGELIEAGSATELMAAGAGLTASFYIGCLAGAVIDATEQKAEDWLDSVFTVDAAKSNAQQIASVAARVGAKPAPSQSIDSSALVCQPDVSDQNMSFGPRVPADSCSDETVYSAGWPSNPSGL